MGHAMRKRVFRHMLAEKAQISLRIRAVWSGSLLFAKRIITIEYMKREKYPDETLRMRGKNLKLCVLRMFEDTISLDVAHIDINISKRLHYCGLHLLF